MLIHNTYVGYVTFNPYKCNTPFLYWYGLLHLEVAVSSFSMSPRKRSLIDGEDEHKKGNRQLAM